MIPGRQRPKGRRRAGRRGGFSLIELMVVVSLLGIIAALSLPGFGAWMADSRQRKAAYAVLRMARQAQSLAYRDGAAWSLRYNAAGGGGHGTLVAYRGMTNRCTRVPGGDETRENWLASLTFGPDGEQLNMVRYNNQSSSTPQTTDNNRYVIEADVYYQGDATPRTDAEICYEPSGRVYATNAAGIVALQTQRITFEVRRSMNGTADGVARRVVFFPGGQARIQVGQR